jgi:hypothetical protein
MQKKPEETLWIANISDRNVSLSDLGITIKAYSNINLLDKKNYYFSMEEISNSIKNGSIHLKSDKIKVRKVAPNSVVKYVIPEAEGNFNKPLRSPLKVVEEEYEELNLSDEKFAEENADTAEKDRLPVLSK